jgi:thiamine pyrophosphate-dependent acetolactate synthase large subunit-like protein
MRNIIKKMQNVEKVYNGYLLPENIQAPKLIYENHDIARPGYNSCKSNEYMDSSEILERKVEALAELIKKSKNFVVYTGAGISTAAGIGDYASKSAGNSKTKTFNWINA